jgi:hypothetical protein
MGAAVSRRLFTVEKANALIPRLEIFMGKLQRHGLALREQLAELARQTGQAPDDLSMGQILELRPQLQPLVEELQTLLDEIDACGGQMKGLDLGLVDFPAEIDGEIVLLCWQYGEKEIAYYHSLEGGFAGRKPLSPTADRSKSLQ